jgi:hypothetical protein
MGELRLFGALKGQLFLELLFFIAVIVYSISLPIGTVDVGAMQ